MSDQDRTESPLGSAGAADSAERHVPVLLDRVVTLFDPALAERDAVLVDATLGAGGHSAALLRRHSGLTLVGVDRDESALRLAGERLAPHADRVHLVHAVFDALPEVLADLGYTRVQGVLFDLGVSSMQLDEDVRGFSYARDAPLDMRMDPSTGPTAADVLNTYDPGELVRILREYGEERAARRIVEAVVRARRRAPLQTSAEPPPPRRWRVSSRRRSPPRRDAAAGIPPSGRSRRCGSR